MNNLKLTYANFTDDYDTISPMKYIADNKKLDNNKSKNLSYFSANEKYDANSGNKLLLSDNGLSLDKNKEYINFCDDLLTKSNINK